MSHLSGHKRKHLRWDGKRSRADRWSICHDVEDSENADKYETHVFLRYLEDKSSD